LQTGDRGSGDPGTGNLGTLGPGTGNLRDLCKGGPLCQKERIEKRERKKTEASDLEEQRPAAKDAEDQCKVISDGSGDF